MSFAGLTPYIPPALRRGELIPAQLLNVELLPKAGTKFLDDFLRHLAGPGKVRRRQ